MSEKQTSKEQRIIAVSPEKGKKEEFSISFGSTAQPIKGVEPSSSSSQNKRREAPAENAKGSKTNKQKSE